MSLVFKVNVSCVTMSFIKSPYFIILTIYLLKPLIDKEKTKESFNAI